MQYGMIGYYVPHRVYPAGYHCDPKQPLPFASLASQKNYLSLYLFCIYSNPDDAKWFQQAWAKSGKKLNMGKSCVRFKTVEDLPLDVIGAAIKRVTVAKHIEQYESVVKTIGKRSAERPAKTGTRIANVKSASRSKASVKTTAPAKRARSKARAVKHA